MVNTIIGVILLAVGLYGAYFFGRRDKNRTIALLEKRVEEQINARASCNLDNTFLQREVDTLQDKATALEINLKTVINQKKSSEVRTGLIAEQLAPFLEGFKYNPRDVLFLGKPVDLLVFDDTGVHFIEVKSGKSQLTPTQRSIREHIENKNITFEVYRIKGE